MAQTFTPNATETSLGFTGEESADDFDSLTPEAEEAGEEEVPLIPGETPAEVPPVVPEAPPASPVAAPEAVAPQPTLADVLKLMEAQATRQTQILDRALPPPATPDVPKPLPPIPEKYRGVLDEETLRGAQVVMEALGITADLEELKQFRQGAAQRENSNSARDLIVSQVPEMKEQAFQDEVAAEMTRTMDSMGVPNELRSQFLNPIFVVQAGNAVKARRSQSAAVTVAPTPDLKQALASRAGGETQTSPTAGSVSDSSQEPVDWMTMSEEDFAKKQAAILRKQNGSW